MPSCVVCPAGCHVRVLCRNGQRYSHCCYGTRIVNRTQDYQWYHFQWLWVTTNGHFKVTIYYADNLQLYMYLSSEDFNDLSAMEICAVDVSRWLVENALLLNPDKTEAVVFGTRKRLPQLHLSRGIDWRLWDAHWLRRIHQAVRCGSRCQFDVWKTCWMSYVDAVFTSELYGISDHFWHWTPQRPSL